MTETARLLIDSKCALGEGPFWHPGRQELFYFDINNNALFAAKVDGTPAGQWSFDESAAAAALIDDNSLAIVTETGLKRLDLATGALEPIIAIEADKSQNRANDSRVHPSGAFWIGTMRKDEDVPDGSLYHYRAGVLTRLREGAVVPNSTCFSPDGRIAYWSDTPTKHILKCETDSETGMPIGAWTLFADISDHRGYPDGSVVDSAGYLWNARWGGHCVVRHAPDGSIDRIIEVPVSQVSCPAFGGPDLKTLFLTTAAKNLTAAQLAAEKFAGGVFAIDVDVAGLPEKPIRL